MGSGRTVRTLKRRMAFTRAIIGGGLPDSCKSFTDVSGVASRHEQRRAFVGKPSSVGRVTATPPATTPASPDSSSTGARPSGQQAPTTAPPQHPIGRIPVQDVRPLVDVGRRPAKSVVGEEFTVSATVFREGHDAVNATAVLVSPDGKETSVGMRCTNEGLNAWAAEVSADAVGWWTYRVEGGPTPTAPGSTTPPSRWPRTSTPSSCSRRARVIERALEEVERTPAGEAAARRGDRPARHPSARPGAAACRHRSPCAPELAARPLRDYVSPSPDHPARRARARAVRRVVRDLPRSEGAVHDPVTGRWKSGTLRTAAQRLPAVAGMGFDVIYLTPIHPIGTTARKGPNNTLHAGPDDPGAPTRSAPRRWARRDPPGPRHLRRFRPLRGRGRAPWPGGGVGHRAPVLARPPLRRRAPRVVHDPGRRHDRLRREPAEEVPGHLPAQLRQRPAGRLRGDAPDDPGGSTTGSRSSASTTRTPSPSSSGSGSSTTWPWTTPTSSGWRRRSPSPR